MSLFESNQAPRVPRAKFDLSHDRKITLNMGKLYPVLNKEVLPGDVWRLSPTVFLRFLALLAPIMHKVNVKLEIFFCPYRLVWTNFPDFVSGGESGTAAPSFPTFNLGSANSANVAFLQDGSLLDYLGFPTYASGNVYQAGYSGNAFSALHPKVYQLIYDQWYRNQNVETTILPAAFLSDGAVPNGDYAGLLPLRVRQWERDYFTSCQPSTQRGTAVVIPIQSTITSVPSSPTSPIMRQQGTNTALVSNSVLTAAAGQLAGTAGTPLAYWDPNGSLIASNTSLTVNALRASITLQTYKERMQRGGGRYIEYLWNVFGVASEDARLQRAELIGTLREPVTISEVLTTSTGTGTGQTPPATLAGHGISVGHAYMGTYAAKEHGAIMAMMSVVPRTAYQNSIPAEFWRQVNTDFYVPDFAHLGEQTIIQQQVYFNMTDAAQAGNGGVVFGYQSRFAEYKYANDQVSAQFKGSLGFWHLGRQFTSASVPALNLAFTQANVRTDIFAVSTDVDHLVCDIYWDISVLRPIPYYGTPSQLNQVQ
jgi:hypothetical protein